MKLSLRDKHVIDFIFPIALFFVFAASSFAVLVLSANVYHSQTAGADENYMLCTPLSYVNEKIRQNDADGNISIRTIEGQDCLVIRSDSDAVSYTIYIYELDGMLKELTLRDGVPVSLKDGRDVMESGDFKMNEVSEGLFRFRLSVPGGKSATLLISERSTP